MPNPEISPLYAPFALAFTEDTIHGDESQILEELLAVSPREEYNFSWRASDDQISKTVTDRWLDERPTAIAEAIYQVNDAIENPIWTEEGQANRAANLHEYRSTIEHELGSRELQRHYYRGLELLVGRAIDPDEFTKLTVVRNFLHVESRWPESSAPGHASFINMMIRRAVTIEDIPQASISGDADPTKAAKLLVPAVETLVQTANSEDDETPQRDINRRISQGMLLVGGLAENVAAARLRGLMADRGYEGFDDTEATRRRIFFKGDRYITGQTVRQARTVLGRTSEDHVPDQMKMHVPPANMELTMYEEITGALNQLGDHNPRLTQILDAISRMNAGQDRAIPRYINLIEIANQITPGINRDHGLEGDDELKPLDARLPEHAYHAFHRILLDVDPELYTRATATQIEQGDPLRMVSVYLEAVLQHRQDIREAYEGVSIGDLVLAMRSQGLSNEMVADRINTLAERANKKRNG